MSFDDGLTIWVGDLDAYINVDFATEDDEAQEQERMARRLETALDECEPGLQELGNISLLSGKSLSAQSLNANGISSKEWRWAIHQAQGAMKQSPLHLAGQDERDFVNDLLSLGRGYAVARYAKLENVSYSAALTATFQYGLKALLDQFLRGQKIINRVEQFRAFERAIRTNIVHPKRRHGVQPTAYSETGHFQTAIHEFAIHTHGHNAHLILDKDATRCMLSLIRLHFLIREMEVSSFKEIRDVYDRYTDARLADIDYIGVQSAFRGKKIKNWKLRHLHPITHFYPYSIRYSILRGLSHFASDARNPDREVLINELALARCGLDLMKKRAIEKSKKAY